MFNPSQTVTTSSPPDSLDSFLAEYEPEKPKRGQIREGVILQIEEDSIILDIGAKRDAIVPRQEYARLSEKKLDALDIGEEVPVYIMRTPRGDEPLLVSIKRGEQYEDWKTAQKQMDEDDVIEVKVIGYNRGGLEIKYHHLQGFIPNSLLSRAHRRLSKEEYDSLKQEKIGATVPAKIIEVHRQRRRLIFSCIAAEAEARQRRIESLHVGDILTGTVVNLVEFGAFVDIGGADGLVHISEISWDHVHTPGDVLSVGDEIEVLVKGVDVDRGRISLSRKALLPSPWKQIGQHYHIGDIVEGKVTNVRQFGAFVRLPHGVEGLIHESEIGMIGNALPGDVLKSGDEVIVRVLNIEPDLERMKLSMRQVPDDMQPVLEEENPQAESNGVIRDFAHLGAVLDAEQNEVS